MSMTLDQHLKEKAQRTSQAPLDVLQQQAAAHALQLGWPTRAQEAWRYTRLHSMAQDTLEEAPRYTELPEDLVSTLPSQCHRTVQLVFLNGWFVEERSTPPQPGIWALSLKEDPLWPSFINQDHFVAALNTAFMPAYHVLRVHPDQKVRIELLFFYRGKERSTHLSSPRLLIEAQHGSHLTLFEQHISLDKHAHWVNALIEAQVHPSARCHHHSWAKLNDDAPFLHSVYGKLDAGSDYNHDGADMGHAWTRRCIALSQTGEGSSSRVHLSCFQHEQQQTDYQLLADLTAKNCHAEQSARSIADDKAHVTCNAAVHISNDAPGCSSEQQCHSLLLSPQARVNAKPELQIDIDNVQCQHGATVGKLDDKQLFYLQARGHTRRVAKDILTAAFLCEHLQQHTEPEIATWLLGRMLQQFQHEELHGLFSKDMNHGG